MPVKIDLQLPPQALIACDIYSTAEPDSAAKKSPPQFGRNVGQRLDLAKQ